MTRHGCRKLGRTLRVLLAAAMAAVLCLLSGCALAGTDLNNQLRPPRGTGEQEKIQQVLEDYIYDKMGKKTSYVLKYPRQGENRAAFILEDMDGDGSEEAYAFYRIGAESEKTRVCYLRKTAGDWGVVTDLEGFSSDIDQVMVGSLQRNGIRSLCVGWQRYNSRDKELLVYTPHSEAGLSVHDVGLYAAVLVEDLTNSGYDDILLLTAGDAEHRNTAQLWSVQDSLQIEQNVTVTNAQNVLTMRGSAQVDGYIQSYGLPQVAVMPNTTNCVFVDGYKDGGSMVTELLYWDGERLVTPFYDVSENRTNVTSRESGIPSMDIDGDNMVEWPQSSRLNGYNAAEAKDSMWSTEWCSWEFESQTAKREFTSLVNLADGYCLRVDASWIPEITASYSAASRSLTLMPYKNNEAGQAFMVVRVSGTRSTNASEADLGFQTVATVGDTAYAVWYARNTEFDITMNLVQYMLMLLP